MNALMQSPQPGEKLLRYRGDLIIFTLTLASASVGRAYVRTNIGHAAVGRSETIAAVDQQRTKLGRDWFDIPMQRQSPTQFRLTLALQEVGHFEGKAFFLPDGSPEPVWADGANTSVNVEPAHYCCGNSIYNAFVRQFGPNKQQRQPPPVAAECITALDDSAYVVIPPSGTFRDLIRELDFIFSQLHCRILQLLPIHPTPTVFGRMGRFGSPYAALDFTGIDPALAEFDRRATALDQFHELIDAVHARHARLFLDIAINHTGWGAKLHETNPEWFVYEEDGCMHSPGAWGVTWEDLTELDHNCYDLWQYLAEMFLVWCRRGVDGFRCDAGYMIPFPAWQYIVATVRNQFPDVIFLLEGLGGDIRLTRQLLDVGNLNWAYSELFQNYTRQQVEHYLPEAIDISRSQGLMVHFAETHDNTRLAAKSHAYARMRTALAALCSCNGAFAFANGVEWYAEERINVHQACSLNWSSADNQIQLIARLNAILAAHPAFHPGTELRFVQQSSGESIALLRFNQQAGKAVLVLANLRDDRPTVVDWSETQLPFANKPRYDMINDGMIKVTDGRNFVSLKLDPGQVLCLSDCADDLIDVHSVLASRQPLTDRALHQHLRALALDVYTFYHGYRDSVDIDPDAIATQLSTDPLAFCREMNPHSNESRLIIWQWPRDLRRTVMLPPDHFLLVRSELPFRARLEYNGYVLAQQDAIPRADHNYFTLFCPVASQAHQHTELVLNLWVYETVNEHRQQQAKILSLCHETPEVLYEVDHAQLLQRNYSILDTNARGGMLRANGAWAELYSRYDALLAGNMHATCPSDRQIMFTRCRGWINYQGYSRELNLDCLEQFRLLPGGGGEWDFLAPIGLGASVRLIVTAEMLPEKNGMQLQFHRLRAAEVEEGLADDWPVRLILRPDIEDRNFHDVTKAFTGPENAWPQAVSSHHNGFLFSPADTHRLSITASTGSFTVEPEWQYMVHRKIEAERGLDPDSDLFSPGWFAASIGGNDTMTLTAQILTSDEPQTMFLPTSRAEATAAAAMRPSRRPPTLLSTLKQAMQHFIVRRDQGKTVIAGYPWFLDWGRDTLICARGMIAAGMHEDVEKILLQFARFEHAGTLPNMIRGDDARNRDTSDAPLWLIVACADFLRATGSTTFLQHKPDGQRTLLSVLESIAHHYEVGTANGIYADAESGLIYSPSHFTWMDTNYPAGTPRQGYPVEIQALWYAALTMLSKVGDHDRWLPLASKVRGNLHKYFFLDKLGYYSDCLHADAGISAAAAVADNHLRSNQLLVLTLGAAKGANTAERVLQACEQLLIPGAIRSLADQPVEPPLPIIRDGVLLNDPRRPYCGQYEGDEDTRRKAAYHNGTAWTWPFPSFAEAWYQFYGKPGKATALAWLRSSTVLLNHGSLGQLPEIVDGDYPHLARGCDAQAWGVTELYRVLRLLGV